MNRLRFGKKISLALFLTLLAGAVSLSLGQQPTTPPAQSVSQYVERNPANWKEFKSQEGAFSIVFPGQPKTRIQPTEAPGITFTLHLIQLTTFAEYSVMYADYPESISDRDPAVAQGVLDDGLAGAVAEVHSKLLSVKEISIDGHSGRLYAERMPGGEVLRGKTFLVDNRLFQIAITTPKEEGVDAETVNFYKQTATKFLDSFRLISKPAIK
jgi:hypothetical protein